MRSPNKPHICMRHLADDMRMVRCAGYIVQGKFYPFDDAESVRRALYIEHKDGCGGSNFYGAEPFIAEHGADYDRAN